MKGRCIAFISALTACTWLTAVCASGFEIDRGRRILLDCGLQIQAQIYPQSHTSYDLTLNVTRWLRSNFTTVNFGWNRDANLLGQLPSDMPWGRWDGGGFTTIPAESPYLGNLVSLQYGDEWADILDPIRLNSLASTYSRCRGLYPNTLIYTNGYGGTGSSTLPTRTVANVMQEMQVSQPDMVCFDYYPGFSFSNSDRETWYRAMQVYRVAALTGNDGSGQKPIPYGQYLNLYRKNYSSSLPSESYVRLQQFASWAFGYTFVSAFIYNDTLVSGLAPTMFSSSGDSSPTAVFDYVAETNRQSRNLGPALVRLVSTDICMIPGKTSGVSKSLPSGISAWAPGPTGANHGNDYIVGITPIKGVGGSASTSYSDVLVGYFSPLLEDNSDYPFADGWHFMIVNGASQGTALASSQWYRLIFSFGNSGFDSLQRINRDTGEIELVPLTSLGGSGYSLDLCLPGGTGDLFRFWDSTPVPEPGAFVMLAAVMAFGLLACIRQRQRKSQNG